MTTRDRILAVLVLALSAGAPAIAAAEPEAPRPAYRREQKAAPPTPRPAPRRAPDGLVAARGGESRRAAVLKDRPAESAPSAAPAEDASVRAAAGRAAPRPAPVPRPGPSWLEIERAGLDAGAHTADGLARTAGRREVYRVGVYDGQRAAFDGPEVGTWDYHEGVRLGRADPGARGAGSRAGERAAFEVARRDAAAQIERQFLDLSWRPVRAPRPADASFQGTFPSTPEPALEAVYREYPPPQASFVPRRFAEGFAGWSWDPWRLHECTQWSAFYDHTWQDPGRAFELWASEGRRAALWRSLASAADRALFRAAFEDGFYDRLPEARSRFLDESYAFGFDDGYAYAAFVKGEWSFRRGYGHGFDRALQFAAEVTFDRAYPSAFVDAYEEAFREWMTTAHPAIVEARLRDGNDDGIFQPGEEVLVDWVVANYGGVAGRTVARLGGAPLAAPVETEVTLEPRRTAEASAALTARLAAAFETPSQETLVLRLDSDHENLPLRVSYPVEFTGEIGYTSLPLERRAQVAFVVANRSRRDVDDVVVTLDRTGESRALGRLAAGRSAEAAFALEGIHPLDLLSGRLAVRADAVVGDTLHARKTARFPELATDLGNSSLVDYLVSLGQARDARPEDAAGARRLLAQRLEVDWATAASGTGNPYKDDVQDGGARTALGALVAAYTREREALSRSMAFNGLGDEVAIQVERLPGAHPVLRKWMKRLAAKMT